MELRGMVDTSLPQAARAINGSRRQGGRFGWPEDGRWKPWCSSLVDFRMSAPHFGGKTLEWL